MDILYFQLNLIILKCFHICDSIFQNLLLFLTLFSFWWIWYTFDQQLFYSQEQSQWPFFYPYFSYQGKKFLPENINSNLSEMWTVSTSISVNDLSMINQKLAELQPHEFHFITLLSHFWPTLYDFSNVLLVLYMFSYFKKWKEKFWKWRISCRAWSKQPPTYHLHQISNTDFNLVESSTFKAATWQISKSSEADNSWYF